MLCVISYRSYGCATHYSDTDSWKVYGDIHNAVRVNEEYNHFIEGIVHNSEDYNIGYFDYEELYAYFATLGCKKYITSDGEEIKCTIAGVNKRATSKAFTELFKRLIMILIYLSKWLLALALFYRIV